MNSRPLLVLLVVFFLSCGSKEKKKNTSDSIIKTTVSNDGTETSDAVDTFVGKYQYYAEWGDEADTGESGLNWKLYADVIVEQTDDVYFISIEKSLDPPGRIMSIDRQECKEKDGKLIFKFVDNWENGGTGTLSVLKNGLYEIDFDLSVFGEHSNVSNLFGSEVLLKLSSDTENKYNETAERLYKDKKYEEAVELLQVLANTFPQNERAMGNYSISLIRVGKLELAEKVALQHFELCNSDESRGAALFNRGLAREKLGNVLEAMNDYDLSNAYRPNKYVAKKLTEMKDLLVKQNKLPGIEDPQEYEGLNYDEINDKIFRSENRLSPEEIMRIYYSYEQETEEGNEILTVKTKKVGLKTEVVLLHENLLDDSMKAAKYIMELEMDGAKWRVTSLKWNWKCWEGRGHEDWGIEFCK